MPLTCPPRAFACGAVSGVSVSTNRFPCTEVRVAVPALLGFVAELGLHCLDRPAACDGLAGHRMQLQLVVAEHAEVALLLHELAGMPCTVSYTVTAERTALPYALALEKP